VKADTGAGILSTILDRYATDPEALPVAIRLCGWGEHAQLLRQGDADAALLYLPFDHTGLDAEMVATEPRVVALAAGHPVAQYDKVELADLDLPGVDPSIPGDVDRYLDRLTQQHRVRDLPQLLALVELGALVTLLPESVVERYPRDGLVYRPVPDAPPLLSADNSVLS
jgi:DNA-binding transcriptional LysR family regulator